MFVLEKIMKFLFVIITCLLNISASVYSAESGDSKENLIFYNGIMFSGKSSKIYEQVRGEKRKDIALITAAITQRDPESPIIHSRKYGDLTVDYTFDKTTNFKVLLEGLTDKKKIYIDEAQFLEDDHIAEIRQVCQANSDMKVFTFGLMYDFLGRKFPSSESLETIADKVEEIDSEAVCPCCERKATYTVRINRDNYHVETSGTVVGTTIAGFLYVSVCEQHQNGDLSQFRQQIDEVCRM